MLKCSTSLWSADLVNLQSEIHRVEPYSERFHLDVADGHYVPNLLFFPDLVKAIRAHTRKPLEMHLMTTDPLAWIEPFCEAGADGFILCLDSIQDAGQAIEAVKRRGKQFGISILIGESVDLLEPYWNELDILTIIGTAMGIKGASMDACVPDKIRQARGIIDRRARPIEIQADGGIRRETVPLLRAAGCDCIVPGSLMFREDPPRMREWLATL